MGSIELYGDMSIYGCVKYDVCIYSRYSSSTLDIGVGLHTVNI